jgi:hypothetical protein
MLTAIGGGYYRVYRDGVEFSRHTTERECIESAYKCKADYPCARVTYKHDYEVLVAKVPVAQTYQQDPAGDGYCYSRPPDDGVGPTAPVLSAAADDDDVVLNWSPAIDTLSGILDYQIERSAVSPESFSLLATVGAAVTTYTDTVGNNASWKYRVRGRDNAPTPNNGTYSNTVSVTTPPSAEQLQPGQLSIEDASYSASEGGSVTIRARRSGNGTSSPTGSVTWTITNASGASPLTGTFTWTGTENGLKSQVISCGSVSATQSGTLTLSNPQAASGSLQPTLGTSSVSFTITDIPSGGYTASGVTGTLADEGTIVIASDGVNGFGATGPTLVMFDDFRSGPDGTDLRLNGAETGTWNTFNNGSHPFYDSTQKHSGSYSLKVKDASGTRERQVILTFTPSTEFFLSYWIRSTFAANQILVGKLKFTWLMDGPNGYDAGGPYDQCWPTRGGSWMISGNDFNQHQNMQAFLPANEWCRFMAWAKSNGASPMNFFVRTMSRTNGVYTATAPNTVNTLFGPSASTSFDRIAVPGYISQGGHDIWYDDFYMAIGPGSPARVEIGDNATYALCREVAILRPTSWSNTSITAKAYQGGHSSLDGKYLFVHDASNNLVTYNGAQGRLISEP